MLEWKQSDYLFCDGHSYMPTTNCLGMVMATENVFKAAGKGTTNTAATGVTED